MLLREHDLSDLKAALLYAEDVDFYCAEAQFTLFVRDLLDAPPNLLFNVARGHNLDDYRLLRHGQSGPLAVQRILRDHLPGLSSSSHSQSLRDIDALKRTLVDNDEDSQGQRAVGELVSAVSTGRVRLKDSIRTDARPDAPYVIDYEAPLNAALQRRDTAVLCNPSAAARVRRDARVSFPATQRATDAALGTGFIAQLPCFPGATVDEILSLNDAADDVLSRYRASMASFRAQINDASPFDSDFSEHLHILWTSEVLPAVADLQDQYHETGWMRYIRKHSEKLVFPAMAALTIGVAPHLSFLDPNLLMQLNAGAVALGSYTTIEPVVDGIGERRSMKIQVERNSLFYLVQLDSQLRV